MASSLPPALLVDELVEEILLRVPPDDPACLVRAALACKGWCRIISDPGFRRRFRKRHRTPPMLGLIRTSDGVRIARFVPTCSFPQPHSYLRMARFSWVFDSRHGRVLIRRVPLQRYVPNTLDASFKVWDPVAGVESFLPAVEGFGTKSFNAAVLCAVAGCDHLDCRQGPFLVVIVGAGGPAVFASVYSSESDAWSKPTCALYEGNLSTHFRGAHVGNSVYFVRNCSPRILEYDLGTRKFTLIDSPPMWDWRIVLMTAEGGGLGCITSNGFILYLWSREAGSDGNMVWEQRRVIDLKPLIPDCDFMTTFCGPIDVVGFEDGSGVIYVGSYYGPFTYDLRTGQVRKLEGVSGRDKVVPYLSFYTPELAVASAGAGPGDGASSA